MPPFRISKDNPAYYLTSVTKDRLPIFRTSKLAHLACKAIDEARKSGGFLIFAYVIMLDHIHLITNNARSPSETHRFVNGIISRRLIDHLEKNQEYRSLAKLRIEERENGWKHSLWQHHPDTRLLWSERMLWQRIQYTHLNPVRSVLVDHPNEWPWTSARIFHGRPIENEPLMVDLNKIIWRKSEA